MLDGKKIKIKITKQDTLVYIDAYNLIYSVFLAKIILSKQGCSIDIVYRHNSFSTNKHFSS